MLCFATSSMMPIAAYTQPSIHYVYDRLPMALAKDQTPYYANMVTHDFKPSSKPKKYSTLPKKQEHKPPKVKEHPRKKLLEEAPLHTQRAWLYSAVIPGLGQYYNESYWKVLAIYGVFGLLTWGAVYNHNEYTTTRRERINNHNKQQNFKNYMQGRERDRTIFLAGIVVWYILNVFDAYVDGALKTFDVSDDLSIIIEEPTPTPKAATGNVPKTTGVSLNFSLQSKEKDEDRSDWIW